jgi:uncharacterized membrane protein YgcG
MPDKNLVCKDCHKEFVFTEGEQAFYREKGFDNEPQRCPECRRAKKQQQRGGGGSYGGGGGGGRSGGGYGGGGGGRRSW